MFWALFMLSRSAFVFKLCFSGFLPNHRMKPGRNDLTQSSCHRLSLSLSERLGNTRPEWKPTKAWRGELNFANIFHIICLLNQNDWESEWQNYKLRQQGGELMWPRLMRYIESYLFIWKSAPLCEVWGCGGGRSFTPVPWPPPEWPLHLKTVPET